MAELAERNALLQSLYFPFEATFESSGDRSAADVAELVRTLQENFRRLLTEALGAELSDYFAALGLLDQVVLVAEIHCSKITIRGVVLTGLGFFAGSLMEPAIQQSEVGRAAIQRITRAIDAVARAGVDTARQGAERIVEAWRGPSSHYPKGRFRIESIDLSDDGLKVVIVVNGGGFGF